MLVFIYRHPSVLSVALSRGLGNELLTFSDLAIALACGLANELTAAVDAHPVNFSVPPFLRSWWDTVSDGRGDTRSVDNIIA